MCIYFQCWRKVLRVHLSQRHWDFQMGWHQVAGRSPGKLGCSHDPIRLAAFGVQGRHGCGILAVHEGGRGLHLGASFLSTSFLSSASMESSREPTRLRVPKLKDKPIQGVAFTLMLRETRSSLPATHPHLLAEPRICRRVENLGTKPNASSK